MDTLDQLKRRLAAMRERGMIGLNMDVANLSPAARQLLAVLTRSSTSPVAPRDPIRVAPPSPIGPRDPPPIDPRDPPPPPPADPPEPGHS